MEDVSSLVARQYEAYAYPPPVQDIAERVGRGAFQIGDPSVYAPLLWPENPRRTPRKILVAGCGSSQAAWLAFTNRSAEIIGIDLSQASLAHQRYLQERHGLINLRLFKGDLLEAASVGDDFDLVVCTGVLHHLADPIAGARALTGVMSADGALACMLYAAGRRTGVYMMQEAFRRMDVRQDAEGVAFVRRVLEQLPAWHPAHWYLSGAPELTHDEAIVDTFLHPQDRAYTVPQVLEFVETSGLHFQSWFENSLYYPEGCFAADHELAQRLTLLPERDQWAAVEMLMIITGMHDFIARKQKPRSIVFDQAWTRLVPYKSPGTQQVTAGHYLRGRVEFRLQPQLGAMFEAVDGARPFSALLTAGANEAAARAGFERLWKQGHVMVTHGA